MRLKIPKSKVPTHVKPKGHGWIYFLYLDGIVVYVGQTKQRHPLLRIAGHTDKKFDSYAARTVPLEDLDFKELQFIQRLKPRYNIAGIKGKESIPLVPDHTLHNIKMVNEEFFTKAEALSYVTIFLKKRGFHLTPNMRDFLFKNMPKYCDRVSVISGIAVKDIFGHGKTVFQKTQIIMLCNRIIKAWKFDVWYRPGLVSQRDKQEKCI